MTACIKIDEDDTPIPQAWFDLNYDLQEEALETAINKDFLEMWLFRLKALIPYGSKCFWMFLSRICELGLFCAASYVDSCELDAAGELMFREYSSSKIQRDNPISSKGGCASNSEVMLSHGVIGKKQGNFSHQRGSKIHGDIYPLVPQIYMSLRKSGYMSKEYVESISIRMDSIKRVFVMFQDMGLTNSELLSRRLSCMSPAKRDEFMSRFCLFNRNIFNDMGRELHQFMRFGTIESRYMVEPHDGRSSKEDGDALSFESLSKREYQWALE